MDSITYIEKQATKKISNTWTQHHHTLNAVQWLERSRTSVQIKRRLIADQRASVVGGMQKQDERSLNSDQKLNRVGGNGHIALTGRIDYLLPFAHISRCRSCCSILAQLLQRYG